MNTVFRTERVTIVVVILWRFSDNEEKGDRSRKGLQAVPANENVRNETTSLPTVFALKRHHLPKVIQPQDGRFPSVPGKPDHWGGGSIDVLSNVLLKDIVGHAEGLTLSIEVFFLQIITIVTLEVADGAGWLGKNLEFAGCFDHRTTFSARTERSQSRRDKLASC